MINPTRTNLLLLKEKSRTVAGGIVILKARRQVLIREFLDTTKPLLRSRGEVRRLYAGALGELNLSLGYEGRDFLESVAAVTRTELGVEIAERSVMGLRYRDVISHESAIRSPQERGYDYLSTTPHLEEAIYRFEQVVEAMIDIAAYESRLKRLGEEIRRITRRVRVLEDRVVPALRDRIRSIAQYISEREREDYYRLRRFKGIRTGKVIPDAGAVG